MSFKSTISRLPSGASNVLLVVLLFVACSAIHGYPWNQDGHPEQDAVAFGPAVELEQVEPSLISDGPTVAFEGHQRFKRATCDLTSGSSNIGSSLCAAHCLAKGYRGGYCNEKLVCVCR